MPALIVCDFCGSSPDHTRDEAEMGLVPSESCAGCGECAWNVIDVDADEMDEHDDADGDCDDYDEDNDEDDW